ncbi:hypothetical protein ACSBR2_023172 [Camellia fascicularis]
MVEIAHRIGYSHDLSQQRRLVNAELLKLPMSNTQRLMATSMIVKDEDKVDLFFSLDENDKMEWVSLLLEVHEKEICSSCIMIVVMQQLCSRAWSECFYPIVGIFMDKPKKFGWYSSLVV